MNSPDKNDPELPLIKSKAHGGTMVLWKTKHDPYIDIHPVVSSAFLPVIFNPPGSILSIHIAVYLPTDGQEHEFVEELSKLSVAIDELCDVHPEAPIFLRGDFNVGKNNNKRIKLFKHFCSDHSFHEVKLPKPTYHHFLGGGKSDSNLDKLLVSDSEKYREALNTIICKHENPLVESHHDIIISEWSVPDCDDNEEKNNDNVEAPVAKNNRRKVLWTKEGISAYESLVAPQLSRIQEVWTSACSKTSMSLLLESTNNVLNSCAVQTNDSIALDKPPPESSVPTPRPIRISKNALLRQSRHLKRALSPSSPATPPETIIMLKTSYSKARTAHRKLLRLFKAKASVNRDKQLHSILSKNPSSFFSSMKRSRFSKNRRISKLKVGNKCYAAESVKDGFYDSISMLKTLDTAALKDSEYFSDYEDDFHNILELCCHGNTISPISEKDSTLLLKKMKPDVCDLYGVTPNHYIHGGPAAWKHFHLLINRLITDVSNTTIKEVNSVYACILFKAHGKDRNIDKSYRTISTCPVVAKALDIHIRQLNINKWNQKQADTQFQGEGSSHELAAVLLTEVIQHSMFFLKKPAYILYLDAMSAFDVVLRKLLIRNLFNSGTDGHSLMYLANRLGNRQTFVDWEGNLMGPIFDQCGLEQGGVGSSDFYKIYGREQLLSAQESKLGISLGNLKISAIGQADDTALVSNNLQNLQYLLLLTEHFCRKYHVKLSTEKTKLQVYYKKSMENEVNYAKLTNPIKVNGTSVDFVECAEHVGIERATSNTVTIFTRFTAHKRALGAVLHAGLARGHRGNPGAGLRVEQLYGVPVLLSGLAPLLLSKVEENMIEQHHKQILMNIQRLLPRTPRTVVFFLGGSLPGTALLHLRQLSIFGMICRLENNIIHEHAVNIFTSETIVKKSWFLNIRQLCLLYSLPHPIDLLKYPLKKEHYKKLVKSHVIDHWEQVLRSEAESLSSLTYFNPNYMSLTTPHPLWTTAGSSPFKIVMATTQSHMISGRYRTQSLCSKWSNSDKSGHCPLSKECAALGQIEDLEHLLNTCIALQPTREKLHKFTHKYCSDHPNIIGLVSELCNQSSPDFCQFLLDCSAIPKVQVFANQNENSDIFNHLFHISRTWVYTLHKNRLKILGRWNTI